VGKAGAIGVGSCDVANVSNIAKRVIFGRALSSDRLGETLLPIRIALPVFASDALSSVAYATEEILLVLALGGIALYTGAIWAGLAVTAVMFVVVLSYRQNVHAYPSGGGDYEVATENLGPNAGVVVASALLVDYVLTVAVSISAAVANLSSAIPSLHDHSVGLAIFLILIIAVLNLRGVKESGSLFAIPTYAFMICMFSMLIWAGVRIAYGDILLAESSSWEIHAEAEYSGLALAFLALRAFSSGCTALTGVEAISNGVPAFKVPKSKNAATTLALLGTIAITMFLGVTVLALITKVRVAESNADLIGLPAGQEQKTVIVQVAQAVFSNFPLGATLVSIFTALILVLAANTAFNGFPVLGSILSRDKYLPGQLHKRGDRLAFSNGIAMLSALAIFLVWVFDAEVTRLIQLYIVGVFVSFTFSQLGMMKHWSRIIKSSANPEECSKAKRSRVVNTVGFLMTGSVLIIVLATKFMHGAYIVCIAMPVIYLIMKAIKRHYDKVARELTPSDEEEVTLPSRVHAIVLVSKIHRPTMRALSYARATRPTVLEAVTVSVDNDETQALTHEWSQRRIPVTLTVLNSPYREVTRPILDYVRSINRKSPRDLVTVYIPEYVVGHWWEQLLHNQSALRLKTRLLFTPGVMVVSVPWQLESSERLAQDRNEEAAGSVRRGTSGGNETATFYEPQD
jgi:amino acid transporter